MTHVPVAVVRNIKSAVEKTNYREAKIRVRMRCTRALILYNWENALYFKLYKRFAKGLSA